MDIEALREKYRDEGYTQGVLAERKEAIRSLERIAAASDIEGAVHREHTRLMDLQAKEASAFAKNQGAAASVGPNGGVSRAVPRGLRQPDVGDYVAAAMAANKRVGQHSPDFERVRQEELKKLLED